MKVVNIGTEKLKLSGYNPRSISEDQFNKLKESIKEFGLVKPIIINKDYTIIGGHQRYRVAKRLNFKELPCVIVDLSKEKEKVLNLALNKIQGSFDEFKLANVIATIDDEKLLDKTGFDKNEIQLLQELLDVDVDYLTKDTDEEYLDKDIKMYQIKLLFEAQDKAIYFELLERYKGSSSMEKTKSLLNYLKEKYET